MKTKDTLKIAVEGLTTHKSRTMLTILGIVIGIASIMLVMSIGQSAQNLILGQIQSFGPTLVSVHPGRRPQSLAGFTGVLFNDSLKQRDVDTLAQKTNVPDAVRIAPYVFTSTPVSFGSESYTTFVMGSSQDVFNSFHLDVAQGVALTDSDVASRSSVAVIGQKLANELFGANNPIGQNIKVKNKNFRVIGVLAPKGQMVSLNWDEIVLTPYSSLQQYVLGIHYFNEISVEASSLATVPTVIADITRVLRQNHNITDPTKDDFYIQTQEDAANTVSSITDILTLLLTSVAAISLVVGGIGIMNIMLVSVTERTREIGLRKSLGATDKNILVQFLTEAIMLTLAGGIIGIILGTSLGLAITYMIDKFGGLSFPYSFSLSGAILGVIVSSVIGLAFGIFPARQASQKSPIEALRYE